VATWFYLRFIPIAAAVLALVVVAFTPLESGQAQTTSGKELFERRCGGCHALDRDKEGPRLRGVYGRTAGTANSFPYSDALKKSKIVWSDETLDGWLTDPEKLVPGNDMTFGVAQADERREIIAYLKNIQR
jgi:cytochrome c